MKIQEMEWEIFIRSCGEDCFYWIAVAKDENKKIEETSSFSSVEECKNNWESLAKESGISKWSYW